MAIALVASVTAAPGSGGGTTSAINTTGATLLVASLNSYGGSPAATISDSKSNTWTPLTVRLTANARQQLFYCFSPTVGAGHTFTAGGGTTYPSILVFAFSGVGSYQTETGAGTTGAGPLAGGSVTPSAAGALIITALCALDFATDSVTPSGFALTTVPWAGGATMQGSVGWQVQGTAAAINPTWSWSGGAHGAVGISTAVFLAAAAAAAEVRHTQAFVETLLGPTPDLRVTQGFVEVLWGTPPTGGGEVPPAPGPPVVDAQTGRALRLFVEIKSRTPVSPGADTPRTLLAAETGLRDRPTWYGGHKPARLVSVSPIMRELADDLRAVECRIVLADVDRLFRTYATWGPLAGAYCAVYVVSDDVRYAEGVPYRLFAGIIQSHRAQPGFQYELIVQDAFSTYFGRLDDSPRVPPFRLSLADFPGMDPSLDGKAAQVVLGEASDEIAYLADRGPQGVVPPQRLGQVNFATLWGGSNIDTDAYIWSHGALVTGGVWTVYYNDTTPLAMTSLTQTAGVATVTVPAGHGLILADTLTIAGASPDAYNGTFTLTGVTSTTLTFAIDPATTSPATGGTLTPNRARRIKVPDSAWGVDVWTPGKPGWAMTGLTTDYVDYHGHRYTPFFIRAAHPLAKEVREGKLLVAGNLYGLAEHGDGTPPYLDSAARLWQWLLVNQLFSPYYTGEYAPVPLLDDVYGVIDTDSVEAAFGAHHSRVTGGYVVGFLLGSEGKQETMRHTLSELCSGADMEQGINRHGQAMLSVEPAIDSPAAEPIVTFTDLHDIEEGAFETWVQAEEYYDRVEHQYGWRYVEPRAPSGTPKEGAPLPESGIPKDQQEWTSGLVVVEHVAARALHDWVTPRVKHVENRVVRSPVVAASLEQTWLNRAVGPEPMFEGPLYFRLTTGWQGLGVTGGTPVDLGSIIAITHTEGYGQHGYITERGQVRTITVDPQRARVTLEGRLLVASTPASAPDPTDLAIVQTIQGQPAIEGGIASPAVLGFYFPTPPKVGRGMLVGVLADYGGLLPGSPTDYHGNIFTTVLARTDGTTSLAIYYCPTITASGSPYVITVDPGVGGTLVGVACDVRGVGAGLAIDRTADNTGSSTTASVATASGVTAPALVAMALMAVAATEPGLTVAATDLHLPGTWTERREALGVGRAGEIDSRTVTAASVGAAIGATWTFANAGAWVSGLAAFKAT